MSHVSPVRWLKMHPFEADAVLAGVVGAVSLTVWIAATTTAPESDAGPFHPVNALGILLILAQIVPLAWRRQAPQAALIASMGASREARNAGYQPKTIPTSIENSTAEATAQ